MRKLLIGLALAALPALVLSACNGNGSGPSGMSALPSAAQHGGRVHHLDNGAQDLHGGGATFPAYGYNLGNQPVGLYTATQASPPPGSILYGATQANGDGDTFYYCLTGSGFGRHEFDNSGTGAGEGADACAMLGATPTGMGGRGDPVDWVGSDVALASTECCASGTPWAASGGYSSTKGWPFEIPTYGGPIVFPYINQGGSGLTGLGAHTLQLSTWTYCAISNGTIGYWDDPAITADNGGTAVAGHQPITFYYRSDGSGTTFLFENKLSNSTSGCNQTFGAPYNTAPYGYGGRSAAWTFAPVSFSTDAWTGPSGSQTSGSDFIGASGNPGILTGIQSGTGSPYATGYAEGAWAAAAFSPKVEQASLLDTGNSVFVSPTNGMAVAGALKNAKVITYDQGVDEKSLGSPDPKCVLFLDPSQFVTPPVKDYPIVGTSYWLFYTKGNGSHTSDLTGLVNYITSTAANGLLGPLEYTPLGNGIHKKIVKALTSGISKKGVHSPCLSS
jgi:ABC-type phosphate transport system substrate-binding protein